MSRRRRRRNRKSGFSLGVGVVISLFIWMCIIVIGLSVVIAYWGIILTAAAAVAGISLIVRLISSGIKKRELSSNAIYTSRIQPLPDRSLSYDEIDESDYSTHEKGVAFEKYCAQLLMANGFSNINMTPYSGDHGVDILATKGGVKYAVQCKCYANNVGNRAIQEIYTGMRYYDADKAVIMTNSYFTKSASDEGTKLEVELWDHEYLQRMERFL